MAAHHPKYCVTFSPIRPIADARLRGSFRDSSKLLLIRARQRGHRFMLHARLICHSLHPLLRLFFVRLRDRVKSQDRQRDWILRFGIESRPNMRNPFRRAIQADVSVPEFQKSFRFVRTQASWDGRRSYLSANNDAEAFDGDQADV